MLKQLLLILRGCMKACVSKQGKISFDQDWFFLFLSLSVIEFLVRALDENPLIRTFFRFWFNFTLTKFCYIFFCFLESARFLHTFNFKNYLEYFKEIQFSRVKRKKQLTSLYKLSFWFWSPLDDTRFIFLLNEIKNNLKLP